MECKIFNRSTMAVNDTKNTKMNKTSVRFKEVALYFSEEEWSVLEPWQKELYNNVMKDIHATLVSLGYTILHRNVLCRIKKIQESYISSQREDGNKYPSLGASVISPDIMLRIKHDEELSGGEEEPANTSPKTSEEPDRFPKVVNMKEEDCEKETEHPFSTSECLSNTFKKSDIKDVQNEEINSNFNLSEANHLVFNPKFSIWIKQLDDQTEGFPQEETHATCTAGGNVNKVKTEKDYSPETDKLLPHQGFTELFSNKENSLEKQPKPPTNYVLSKSDNPGKGEESLLSIVLKRANAGSPYMPNCKYSNGYKGMEYGRGVPRLPEREICYGSKQPVFQRPSGSELLSGFHIRGIPPYHVPQQTDKPFTCHICQKCFKTLGILNVHMKTHTGIRPYQCNECGKSFRDNWNLKVHQKIHTGETPYKCSICEKGFIQYATYMKHQRIHTGEKPYSCCYCDKSFTNSSNLVRHHRTHTGEKPYTCQECGKSFSYNTSLIQHKRTHRLEPVENPATDTSSK